MNSGIGEHGYEYLLRRHQGGKITLTAVTFGGQCLLELGFIILVVVLLEERENVSLKCAVGELCLVLCFFNNFALGQRG